MKWDDEIVARRPTWRGVTYDSQLETNWAATLVSWGMEFKYHPGRIFLANGDVYEPDFQVSNDWIFEVKGASNSRIEKVASVERETSLRVVVGREPFIPPDADSEVPGAVWQSVETTCLNLTAFGYEWDTSPLDDQPLYSADYAYENGLYAARFFIALPDGSIV